MSDKDDKLRNELDAFVADYNDKNKTKFKATGVKGSRKRTGKGTQGHRQFGGVDFSGYGKSKEENTKFMDAMAKRGFRVIDELDAPSYSRKGKKRHVIHIDSMREDVGNTKEKRGTIRKERSVKRKSNNYPIQRVEREQLYRSEMEPSQRAELLNKEKPLSLKEKLKGLSQIDPTGSNTEENINAVLENDPTKLVPQITKDTPRLAMRQDQDGTILGRLRRQANPVETDEQTAKKIRSQENTQIAQTGQMKQKAMGEQLINTQPEAVKEVVNSQVQDPVAAKEIHKDIDNKVKGKERQAGPASQFTEALTFFLPQIIGGLAGAAFEGTEGAIGGIEAGGQARDAFLKNQRAKEELEIKKGGSATEERRLAIAEANLGLRGKKLGLDVGAEERRGKQLDLNMSKFGLQEKQAGELSGKQVDQLKDMNNVEASIDRIEELRQETNTGPLAGRVQSMAQWADAAPESFNKMKSQTASTLSNYVKSISGAQVAEAEAVRLQAVIPSVTDAPGVFKDKLEEFKKIVQMNKKAFAQAIATGQPLKAGAVKGLLEAEKKFKSKGNKSTVKSGFSRADIDAMKERIRSERK